MEGWKQRLEWSTVIECAKDYKYIEQKISASSDQNEVTLFTLIYHNPHLIQSGFVIVVALAATAAIAIVDSVGDGYLLMSETTRKRDFPHPPADAKLNEAFDDKLWKDLWYPHIST